ncbi:uncharacterized protein LOC109847525 [Asparagus officinalis]|uniref:uncharacterized protein LOC109847525 n=1 Tax=Asparagus officinalis TaxID=4686 RepID=UPI00098E0B9D|nr:uncharacterized protein LOC109847525 [Asparagus officinalis]
MVGTRRNGNPSSSSSQMPEVEPHHLLEMIHGLVVNQQFLAGHLQREPQHQPPPRPESSVREFRYMRPPSFSGAEGPLAAEEFLKVTETILTVTRIPHAEWVDLMDIQLTDTARIWWTAEKAHLERPISWDTFTDRFNRKYFPQSAQDELLEDLLSSSKDVDRLMNPTIRRHQFQKGLDKYIRFALAGRALATHDAVLDAACEIKSIQKEPEDPHVIQSRTPAAPARDDERPPSRQQQNPQRQYFSQRQPLPPVHPYQYPGVQTLGQPSEKCSYCSFRGHTHQKCPKRPRLCFNCRSPDHVNRECLQRQ